MWDTVSLRGRLDNRSCVSRHQGKYAEMSRNEIFGTISLHNGFYIIFSHTLLLSASTLLHAAVSVDVGDLEIQYHRFPSRCYWLMAVQVLFSINCSSAPPETPCGSFHFISNSRNAQKTLFDLKQKTSIERGRSITANGVEKSACLNA